MHQELETVIVKCDYPGPRNTLLDALMSRMRNGGPQFAVRAFLNAKPSPECLLAGAVGALRFSPYHRLVDATYGYVGAMYSTGRLDGFDQGVALKALARMDQTEAVAERLDAVEDQPEPRMVVSMMQAAIDVGMYDYALVLASWYDLKGPVVDLMAGQALSGSQKYEEAITTLGPILSTYPEAALTAAECALQRGGFSRLDDLISSLKRVPDAYCEKHRALSDLERANGRPWAALRHKAHFLKWRMLVANGLHPLCLELEELTKSLRAGGPSQGDGSRPAAPSQGAG